MPELLYTIVAKANGTCGTLFSPHRLYRKRRGLQMPCVGSPSKIPFFPCPWGPVIIHLSAWDSEHEWVSLRWQPSNWARTARARQHEPCNRAGVLEQGWAVGSLLPSQGEGKHQHLSTAALPNTRGCLNLM